MEILGLEEAVTLVEKGLGMFLDLMMGKLKWVVFNFVFLMRGWFGRVRAGDLEWEKMWVVDVLGLKSLRETEELLRAEVAAAMVGLRQEMGIDNVGCCMDRCLVCRSGIKKLYRGEEYSWESGS